MARRPEHIAPPEIVGPPRRIQEHTTNVYILFQFYNEDEAQKYTNK